MVLLLALIEVVGDHGGIGKVIRKVVVRGNFDLVDLLFDKILS